MEWNDKEILIDGHTMLNDIQKTFNLLYPYLKLEFIAPANSTKSINRNNGEVNYLLQQLTNITLSKTINLQNNRTVLEICNEFQLLGLPVQVLRKSGKVWNIISVTDGWTLASQNEAGEFISSEMKDAQNK